jgi:hypothetical protein
VSDKGLNKTAKIQVKDIFETSDPKREGVYQRVAKLIE